MKEDCRTYIEEYLVRKLLFGKFTGNIENEAISRMNPCEMPGQDNTGEIKQGDRPGEPRTTTY